MALITSVCDAMRSPPHQHGPNHLGLCAPRTDYPIIGSVAKGFQYHHFHPSAWTVVPLLTMLSHSFLLLGALSAALLAAPPRMGAARVFWSAAMALCLLTVLTHRFVHLPPEDTPGWFRGLQRLGLLMGQEHHKAHHLSLVTQVSTQWPADHFQ